MIMLWRKESLLERKCHYLPKANKNVELGVYFFRDVTNINHKRAQICSGMQSAVQHVVPLLSMKPENK